MLHFRKKLVRLEKKKLVAKQRVIQRMKIIFESELLAAISWDPTGSFAQGAK